MAKAYLCDRCKNFYNKSANSTEQKLFLRKKATHSNLLIDLCPDCYESLCEWYKKPAERAKEAKQNSQ